MPTRTEREKAILIIALVTIFHVFISVGAMLVGFKVAMNHFDSAVPMTFFEQVLSSAYFFLLMPVYYLLPNWTRGWFPGNFEYIPIILNSLVWGVTVWLVYRYIASRSASKGVA